VTAPRINISLKLRSALTVPRMMLDHEGLIEADRIAQALLRLGGVDSERPCSVRMLATRLLGHEPQRMPMRNYGETGMVEGAWRIYTSDVLPVTREPWVIGHELGHWWYAHRGERPPAYEEALCDAIGAALVCPRPAFRRALVAIGYAIRDLARRFRTEESLVLLRIGEVDGLSVLLDSKPTRIARGAPFAWPTDLREVPSAVARSIRVDGMLGMMAIRENSSVGCGGRRGRGVENRRLNKRSLPETGEMLVIQDARRATGRTKRCAGSPHPTRRDLGTPRRRGDHGEGRVSEFRL
jgi:hypothetical protein